MTINLQIEAKRPQAFWLLSDIHIGHTAFDKAKFERDRAKALQARARVLMLGDALEAVTAGSKVANVGAFFDQVAPIWQQREWFVEYMQGFRVLAIIPGNHERRVIKATSECPLERAAEQISRQQHYPCAYVNQSTHVRIKLGRQRYGVHIHHGEGGPTTMQRYNMRDFPGGDVYAAGHTHELKRDETFVHDINDGLRRVHRVRTGSYLHLPSYAADKPPTDAIPATGSWLMWLRPDRHEIRFETLAERPERGA